MTIKELYEETTDRAATLRRHAEKNRVAHNYDGQRVASAQTLAADELERVGTNIMRYVADNPHVVSGIEIPKGSA